jgi:hypothetical protein
MPRWAHKSKFFLITTLEVTFDSAFSFTFDSTYFLLLAHDIDSTFIHLRLCLHTESGETRDFHVRLPFLSSPSHKNASRVYKKTSSNQLLTLYLGTRELVSRAGAVEPIKGVIFVDSRVIDSHQKVYCQLTLTFR